MTADAADKSDDALTSRWPPHTSLGEAIYRMVQNGQKDTPAFKTILSFFGRERVEQLYRQERAKQEALSSSTRQKQCSPPGEGLSKC
jgi:thymidylate kinase